MLPLDSAKTVQRILYTSSRGVNIHHLITVIGFRFVKFCGVLAGNNGLPRAYLDYGERRHVPGLYPLVAQQPTGSRSVPPLVSRLGGNWFRHSTSEGTERLRLW